MTPLPALFDAIESPRFSALVGVANGRNLFRHAVELTPEFTDLCTAVQKAPVLALDIVRRAQTLVHLAFDSRYENPHDAAVATYGLVISRVAPWLASVLSELLQALPNGWWSPKLATDLVASEFSTTTSDADASDAGRAVVLGRPHALTFRSDARTALLWSMLIVNFDLAGAALTQVGEGDVVVISDSKSALAPTLYSLHASVVAVDAANFREGDGNG